MSIYFHKLATCVNSDEFGDLLNFGLTCFGLNNLAQFGELLKNRVVTTVNLLRGELFALLALLSKLLMLRFFALAFGPDHFGGGHGPNQGARKPANFLLGEGIFPFATHTVSTA